MGTKILSKTFASKFNKILPSVILLGNQESCIKNGCSTTKYFNLEKVHNKVIQYQHTSLLLPLKFHSFKLKIILISKV